MIVHLHQTKKSAADEIMVVLLGHDNPEVLLLFVPHATVLSHLMG
jgi:hypothetical protein